MRSWGTTKEGALSKQKVWGNLCRKDRYIFNCKCKTERKKKKMGKCGRITQKFQMSLKSKINVSQKMGAQGREENKIGSLTVMLQATRKQNTAIKTKKTKQQ